MDEREYVEAIGGRQPAADRASVTALVEGYQQPLGAYLFHLVGDLDLALAITRETFLWCRSVVAMYPTTSSLRVALYRVATGLALSRVPSAEAGKAQRGPTRVALRDLAPGERAVLLVCDLEQFPPTEAAEILGVSGEALCRRLARARARFRRAYVDACRVRS